MDRVPSYREFRAATPDNDPEYAAKLAAWNVAHYQAASPPGTTVTVSVRKVEMVGAGWWFEDDGECRLWLLLERARRAARRWGERWGEAVARSHYSRPSGRSKHWERREFFRTRRDRAWAIVEVRRARYEAYVAEHGSIIDNGAIRTVVAPRGAGEAGDDGGA